MFAEIITIGDELLIGQVVDTNSAWMGQELNKIGIEVLRIVSIRDREDEILEAISSQGFEQVGESVDSMSVGSRQIGLIGRIDNFTGEQLQALNTAFLPMTTVRLYFEEKYWIDAVIKEAPVFTYSLRTVLFAVQLLAPYPYWKSVKEHYYKLGGSTGGFNFPVSYDTPHNFEQFNETLFLNCVNRGNTRVDYSAEIRCTSGQAANITITNAGNQKFIAVKTTLTAADTVRIFRENNILRVTKETAGQTSDIFSALDEDSNLFFMDVGDNVIRADKESGDGRLAVVIRFCDTVVGVRYGI